MLSKATVVSALVAVALAQMPAPTCYQGGPTAAGPATDCAKFINTFCDFADPVPMRLNDSIGRCFNLPNNNVCDFIAWNTYRDGISPSGSNCKKVLTNITKQCNLGGFGQAGPGGYHFTVDVNHGQCGHSVHAGS